MASRPRSGDNASMKHQLLILGILLLALLPAPIRADDAPTGSREAWRHRRTPVFTISQGAPQHRCRDSLAVAGGPQEVICKFAYGPWDKDLEDEDVEVFVRPEGSDAWRRLGVGRTGRGEHRDGTRDIRNLDGWMVFPIPGAAALPPGRHRVRAVVQGDGAAVEADLWVLAPSHAVVVFDIDGTLTTGDSELTRELANAAAEEIYHPKIRAGAADVIRARVAAGALPVYLTARPDRLTNRTRAWLEAENLPAGPLQLQSSVAGPSPSPTPSATSSASSRRSWTRDSPWSPHTATRSQTSTPTLPRASSRHISSSWGPTAASRAPYRSRTIESTWRR